MISTSKSTGSAANANRTLIPCFQEHNESTQRTGRVMTLESGTHVEMESAFKGIAPAGVPTGAPRTISPPSCAEYTRFGNNGNHSSAVLKILNSIVNLTLGPLIVTTRLKFGRCICTALPISSPDLSKQPSPPVGRCDVCVDDRTAVSPSAAAAACILLPRALALGGSTHRRLEVVRCIRG